MVPTFTLPRSRPHSDCTIFFAFSLLPGGSQFSSQVSIQGQHVYVSVCLSSMQLPSVGCGWRVPVGMGTYVHV